MGRKKDINSLDHGMSASASLGRDNTIATVLPAKSDSGVMFCLQSRQDLESIDL